MNGEPIALRAPVEIRWQLAEHLSGRRLDRRRRYAVDSGGVLQLAPHAGARRNAQWAPLPSLAGERRGRAAGIEVVEVTP